MARATFNGFSLEIPENWTDESLIVLAGPRPARPGLPTLSPVAPRMAPNVVIRREPHEGDESVLEEMAEHQEREIAGVPGSHVLDRSELELVIGGKKVRAVVREFSIPSPDLTTAQQLQLYFVAGGYVHMFVGTATKSENFTADKKYFVDVASSIRFA